MYNIVQRPEIGSNPVPSTAKGTALPTELNEISTRSTSRAN